MNILSLLDAAINHTTKYGGYPGVGSLAEARDIVNRLLVASRKLAEHADSASWSLNTSIMDKAIEQMNKAIEAATEDTKQ